MKNHKTHEPFFWVAFGKGGMVAAFILPVLILITGFFLAEPAGDHAYLSYEHVSWLLHTWWAAIIIAGLVASLFWHAMHRLYHLLHDFGIHATAIHQFIFYGIAVLATIVAFVSVFM